MLGSFSRATWSSSSNQSTQPKEPTLSCNHSWRLRSMRHEWESTNPIPGCWLPHLRRCASAQRSRWQSPPPRSLTCVTPVTALQRHSGTLNSSCVEAPRTRCGVLPHVGVKGPGFLRNALTAQSQFLVTAQGRCTPGCSFSFLTSRPDCVRSRRDSLSAVSRRKELSS